jgi:anti-anti-sigma regulatory factor
MLRIGVHDENESTSFTVEGKLTAPSAMELEKCWQALITAEPSRSVVVKLAAVTFVDSQSIELLTRMRREGVKLVPTGCLMKAIVAQIEADVAGEPASS